MTDLHTYEIVADNDGGTVDRLRTEGGWLYRTRTWDIRSNNFAVALAFAPDPPSGQADAAAGTCFCYANLVEATLTMDGDPHPLDIAGAEAFGDTSLITSVTEGFAVTGDCVCVIDLWIEFATAPQSIAEMGIGIDKAGTLLARGVVQVFPAMTMQHTGYTGLLQAGQIVKPCALCAVDDDLTVLPSSYITAHIVPIKL